MTARRITQFGDQLKTWPKTTHELVQWQSEDGTKIEGVLHKPENFVKGRRYPLMIVIHGGPSSYSRPSPVDEWGNDVPYPIEVWLKKGALVLEPNYRGSLGYGETFKSLIVGKLGQGEPQDIVSGIDALVKEGIVDNDKVGVAGWSYGGYLTALLSVRYPQRFKAASAGAGITDWQTDYVNSDIDDWFHAFFRSTPGTTPPAPGPRAPQ